MTLTILLPLLVALTGVLVYALANNAKVQEIGRAAMWTGMLATLLVLSQHTIRF